MSCGNISLRNSLAKLFVSLICKKPSVYNMEIWMNDQYAMMDKQGLRFLSFPHLKNCSKTISHNINFYDKQCNFYVIMMLVKCKDKTSWG